MLEVAQIHMGLKAMIKEVDEDLDSKINFRDQFGDDIFSMSTVQK